MRLIDADRMKIGISEQTRTDSEASLFIDIIDGQPTVYDTDRVIKQIEDEITETTEHRHAFCGTVTSEHCVSHENCEDCMAERMMEIIKNGGIGS